MFRKFRLLTIMIAVLLAQSASSSERPSFFGYAPALPLAESDVALTASGKSAPGLARKIVHLHIGGDGGVDSVTIDDSYWRSYIDYVTPYLRGFQFMPALWQGETIESRLPVAVWTRPGERYPQLTFPVAIDSSIPRPNLLIDCLELAGFTLPTVQRFPGFHATVSVRDSLVSAPFTVVQVSLDASGRVIDNVITHDQYANFGRQIETAVLWSEFTPLLRRGEAVDATVYLVASFFPEMTYPTKVFHAVSRDSLALQQRQMLRILPDTLGLARPPIPASFFGDRMRPGKGGILPSGRVPVWLLVDSTGVARTLRTDPSAAHNQTYINDFVAGLRFYPAVRFDGTAVPFTGLVIFYPSDRGSIRIEYDWLD